MDIEFNHLGKVFEGTSEDVTKFMEDNGYKFHSKVGIDALFIKEKNKTKKKSKKYENDAKNEL